MKRDYVHVINEISENSTANSSTQFESKHNINLSFFFFAAILRFAFGHGGMPKHYYNFNGEMTCVKLFNWILWDAYKIAHNSFQLIDLTYNNDWHFIGFCIKVNKRGNDMKFIREIFTPPICECEMWKSCINQCCFRYMIHLWIMMAVRPYSLTKFWRSFSNFSCIVRKWTKKKTFHFSLSLSS